MFGGVLLVLMEVLSDFGAVSILGIDTWTTEVYKAWHGFFSFAGAAQIATLPLLIILILLSIEGWLHRRRRLQGGVQGYERTVQARSTSLRSRTLSTLALGLLVFFSVLLPTAQLLIWLPQSAEHGVLNPSFVYGFFQSLTLGVGAGLLVVFLALLLILSSRFTGSRILASMDKMASLCYALPGPVLALGLLGVFYFLNWPTMGGWVLIMGLALRFLVVGGQPLRGDFLKIPAALDEVSESVGRSRVPLLRKVYAPLIRGGLVTGFLVAALESFKEMPLTLMLRPFGWEPLSVQIYSLTTEGEYERAALPALLLVLLSVISVTVVWFQQGGEKNAQG